MSNEDKTELRNAAESLDSAREHTENAAAADRLDGFADRVRKMADADRGPDHGSLARLEHGLQDVRSDLGEEAAEAVDAALSHARAYRETVEGV